MEKEIQILVSIVTSLGQTLISDKILVGISVWSQNMYLFLSTTYSKSDTYFSLLISVYIQTIILQITQQKANKSLGADKVPVCMHTPETLLQIP